MEQDHLGGFGDVRLSRVGGALLVAMQSKRTMCVYALGHSRSEARQFQRKIKCTDCPNRDFLPVTDEGVDGHLRGRHTVGVYPILANETCWFLAADFDESTWREDVAAFPAACKAHGVPAADVSTPRLVRTLDGHAAEQIWIHPVRRRPASGVRLLVDRLDPHYPHQPPYPLAVHGSTRSSARSSTAGIAPLSTGGGPPGQPAIAVRSGSRPGSSAKKITLNGQLADLRVQVGDLRLIRRASRRALTAREQRGDPLEQRLLPRMDLARMHALPARQLRYGAFLPRRRVLLPGTLHR